MYVAYLFILKNLIIVKTVKIIIKDRSSKASLIFFCLKKNQDQIKLKTFELRRNLMVHTIYDIYLLF